jgi:hypothetical protein
MTLEATLSIALLIDLCISLNAHSSTILKSVQSSVVMNPVTSALLNL